MRVCPKCGFQDSPNWENCRFKRDLMVMRLETFKKEYPHLAKRIEEEKYVRDGQFVYHKTKLYVLRKEPADFNQPFWELFEAHKKAPRDMAHYYNKKRSERKVQRKLLDGNKEVES